MPLNLQNFIIDPLQRRETEGLVRLGQTTQRNREWEFRQQQQQDADQWRKINLIQELTDLSKHQTGSDVANSLGDKLMTDVFQRYTTNMNKMSGQELTANIQRDMSGIIRGMEGAKNELMTADKQMTTLKQLYPNLNTAQLYDEYRKDIVTRRLNNDLSGFKNEMEVSQSQIDINNPDFLSKYVTGDKNLRTYFTNPQGLDVSDVYTGNRNNYTKFSAKIPAWKKPSFNPEDVEEGFLKKGTPSLSFKSSTLPSDAMPSSKGQPFEMIDADVFNQLGGNEKLELIAATRKQVPGYDKLNQTEKEYAQRHIYLKTAKSLDQLDFHPTDIKTPSASMLRLWGGGGSGSKSEVSPIDLTEQPDTPYGKNITSLMQGIKVTGLPDGKTLLAENVEYDPVSKRVKYKEYVSQDEQGKYGKGQEREVSLTKFKQDIKTNNPGIDMKFLDGLDDPILDKKETKKEEPKTPIKKITVKGL